MNQQPPLGDKFYNRQYDITQVANTVAYSIQNLSATESEHVLTFVLSRVRAEIYGQAIGQSQNLDRHVQSSMTSPMADLPQL